MAGPTTEAVYEVPTPRVKTTSTVLRLHVNSAVHGPTNTDQNSRLQDRSISTVGKLRHFSKMCRLNPENQDNGKTEVKHIDTEEQSSDYAQSEYTTPYYLTNDKVKASVKCLKTTAKVHCIHNKDTEHIRPLWVAQSQGSQVLQTDCEVDIGAGCNILPTHKAQQLFGQE